MHPPVMLRALKATAAVVPLPTPLRTASGVIADSPLVLIDLETSAGLTGHAYLMGYTPLTLKALVQLLETLGEELTGAVVAPEALTQRFAARFRLLGTAGLLGMALAEFEAIHAASKWRPGTCWPSRPGCRCTSCWAAPRGR